MTISNVAVQCFTNKVVFGDKFTLELSRYVLINEYAVKDVRSGEDFTADCNFAWSLLMKNTGGFFIMGGPVPGKPHLGIPFTMKGGLPIAIFGGPVAINSDFVEYVNYPVTSVDGTFTIRYKVLWSFVLATESHTHDWFERQ